MGKDKVMVQAELLRMEGISKAFGGVKALDNVDFTLQMKSMRDGCKRRC